MNKVLIGLIILSISVYSYAEDLYIAQHIIGNDNGKDAFNAHSIEWFNRNINWGDGEDLIGPGDTVHLVGTITDSLVIKKSGRKSSPITILFEKGSKLSKPAWGVDSEAAIYASEKDYIIIDGGTDGTIECTDNGTELAIKNAAQGISINRSDYWIIKNLSIINIYKRMANSNDSNRFGRGIRANTCSYLTIKNCRINNLEYALHVTAEYYDTTKLDIYDCDISKCSTGIVLALSNAVDYSDLNVYRNKIYDLFYWDGTWNEGKSWHHKDGIHTWGNFPNNSLGPLRIYDNEFFGNWGTHVTGWIFIEDYTESLEIYNNSFTNAGPKPALGFIALTPDKETAKAYIKNNILIGGGADNTGGTGIDLRRVDVTIERNIFKDLYTGIHREAGDVKILSDYNQFANVSNIGHDAEIGFIKDLYDWQSYLGGCPGISNDCNSTKGPIAETPHYEKPPTPKNLKLSFDSLVKS